MKSFAPLLLLCCFACDTREVKLQRFLLQGNEQAIKQNYREAQRYFLEAIRLDSCFSDAWNNLGTVYFKQQHFEEALDSYTRAIECTPGFEEAFLNRANTHYELDQLDAAHKDLDEYWRRKGDTSTLFFSRALIFTKQQRYDEALRSFRKALALDRDNREILVNIGTVLYHQRRLDSARVVLSGVLSRYPEDVNALNTLSLVEAEEGRYGQALSKRPRDAFFLNNRGYYYLLSGQLDKARVDIDASIGEDPYNGWAYRNKGMYYLKINEPQHAIRVLERARDTNMGVEKINALLGEAYAMAGETQKACGYYLKAVQKNEMEIATFKKACPEYRE